MLSHIYIHNTYNLQRFNIIWQYKAIYFVLLIFIIFMYKLQLWTIDTIISIKSFEFKSIFSEDFKTNFKDLDEETLGRIDFQNQVQTLMEELEFLRRVHEQEVKELQALLAQAPADTREFFKNELALAIRDIKDEYDYIAKQGKQDMESWYKLKVYFFFKLLSSKRFSWTNCFRIKFFDEFYFQVLGVRSTRFSESRQYGSQLSTRRS